MSKVLNKALGDAAVVHRLCFAARTLPVGSPGYWDTVANFSTMGKRGFSIAAEEAKVFVENLQYMNPGVFECDAVLMKQLVRMPKGSTKDQEVIGMVLVSPVEVCILCGHKLSIRQDRCVCAVIYDDYHGSMPALHYTRYCRRKGCSLQQHYGYYTQSDSGEVTYNQNALSLPYFMCSRETGLSVKLLQMLDMECLIGQISYKQSAEIYNSYHGYECTESELEKKRYILLI